MRATNCFTRLVSWVLIMCLLLSINAGAVSDKATNILLTKTEGTVTVTNRGGKKQTLREDMHLYSGYHTATGTKSYAWFNLDDTKLNKLDASSEVEVRKSGKKLEMLLEEGSLFFDVTEPLEDDESLEIRTSSMMMGIRGTCGWLRVVDQRTAEVSLLEGTVRCTVKDPVSEEQKTAVLHAGETATFLIYPEAVLGDHCEIIRSAVTPEDIEGYVAVELAGNPELCEEIRRASGLDLTGVTPEAAEERLRTDQVRETERRKEIDERIQETQPEEHVDPVWVPTAAPATPDQPIGGGHPDPAPDTQGITLPAGTPTPELQDQLGDLAVDEVRCLGPIIVTQDTPLTVPAGKTLTTDQYIEVQPDATLTVDGTLRADDPEKGSLTNDGTIEVTSGNSLHVAGRFENRGLIRNTERGRIEAAAGITNYGDVVCDGASEVTSGTDGATIQLRASTATLSLSGGTVTNSGHGCAVQLDQAAYVENVTYTADTDVRATAADRLIVAAGLPVTRDAFDIRLHEDGYWHLKVLVQTVHFDANGGTGDPTTVWVIRGESVATDWPGDPVREGCTFAGWNTSADGTGDWFTASTPVRSDLTVYAIWKITETPETPPSSGTTYTVTFHSNNGTGPSTTTVAQVPENGMVGSAQWPAPPVRDGYTFTGWNTAMDGRGDPFTTGTRVTRDMTVYAQWLPVPSGTTYTVTYHANGGTVSPGSETVAAGGTAHPPTPTRDGYTFEGWNTAMDGRGDPFTVNTAVTGDLTVYAQWRPAPPPDRTYTVTYHANGGTVSPGSETVAAGGTAHPPTPTRTGTTTYTFVEWNTQSDGLGDPFTSSTPVTADITVYAIWCYMEYTYHSATKLLEIRGFGPMPDYSYSATENPAPWVTDPQVDCTNTTGVTITGLNRIGNSAFKDFTSLTAVSISDSVTSIGDHAFFGCRALNGLTIPDSVTSIGVGAFGSCENLDGITIPDGVTSIGVSAFSSCKSLSSITVPGSVAEIENGTFSYCDNLNSVTLEAGVRQIDDDAFNGCKTLTTLNLPDSLTGMGLRAFADCVNLPAVTLPNGFKRIGMAAFDGCTNLKTINLLGSIDEIGASAFSGCSALEGDIVIPDGVRSLGYSTFFGCSKLDSVTIPGSVTSVGNGAFQNCTGLTSLTLTEGLETIGTGAFQSCTGLTGSLSLPDSVKNIGERAFYGCTGLTGALTIPGSVTSIGDYAFYYCTSLDGNLTFTLPSSLTTIGPSAFANCTNLTGSLTIPDSVTTIGESAFYLCRNLTGTLTFTLPGNLTTIGSGAFEGTGLTGSLSLPDSVKNIGERAFYGCTGLTGALTIPGSVTSIGDYAFYYCTSLDGNLTFTLPSNLTTIGDYAFSECIGLNGTLTLPDSMTTIGTHAFSGCSGLTGNLTIPDSVTSIGASAFSGCSGLGTVKISNHVTSMEAETFAGCSGLISAAIPVSVGSVGQSAFSGCGKLTNVYYGGTEEQWGKITIDSDNDPLRSATIIYSNYSGARRRRLHE